MVISPQPLVRVTSTLPLSRFVDLQDLPVGGVADDKHIGSCLHLYMCVAREYSTASRLTFQGIFVAGDASLKGALLVLFLHAN